MATEVTEQMSKLEISQSRKVLIAVNGGEPSLRAFEWYLKNTSREDDEIIFVHVVELPQMPYLTSYKVHFAAAIHEKWTREVHELVKQGKALLASYGEKCPNKNHRFIIESGVPSAIICKVAREEKANVVLIGSRGKNAIRRTTISYSDAVIHASPSPVICVRPPDDHHHS